jgi:hypothetical protein
VQTEGENQKKLFSSNANSLWQNWHLPDAESNAAQLLRQTRTAPYSKKEITDVCQIHSQKKQKERRPGELLLLLLLLLLTNPSRLSVVMSRKPATVVAEEEAKKKKKLWHQTGDGERQ